MKRNTNSGVRKIKTAGWNVQRKISLFCFLVAVCTASPAFPQTEKLHQALLDATSGFTLMSVAAHPDDEDIEAVTYYRKKFGVRAVVVVASRGEGGQNEIGPELYADLGVVRSEEMRRAEAISGGEYFNMNFVDFGYSKNIEETYQKWGRQEIRRRLVRMIRMLKPQVIITNHDSTSGHSNHQAVGRELVWAFRAAGGASIFSEQIAEGLSVWQPLRLFCSMEGSVERVFSAPNSMDRQPSQATGIVYDSVRADVHLQVGEYSPWLGKTYARHAAEALSQHRSQGMHIFAARIPDGPRWRYYRLIETTGKVSATLPSPVVDDLFSGLPNPLPAAIGSSKKAPAAFQELSRQAQSDSPDRHTILEHARVLVDELNKKKKTNIPEHMFARAQELLATALGVEFTLSTSQKVLITGQRAELTWNWKWEGFGGPTPTSGRPGLLKVFGTGYRIYLGNNVLASSDDPVALPEDATAINFSAKPRIAENQPLTRPLTKVIYENARLPEPLWGESFFTYRGVKFTLWRTGLSTAGIPEVAAPIEVEEPRLPIIVASSDAGRSVSVPVQIRNHLKTAQPVTISIKGNAQVITQTQMVVRGDTLVNLALPINATLPAEPWRIFAEIRAALLRAPLVVSYEVVPIDLAVPPVRVGLIKSYDNTLEWALRSVNVPFVEITDADLVGTGHARSLPSHLQTIIVDMRAYLARPELRANNVRLLEWIKAGGHAIVMYHKTFEWNPSRRSQAGSAAVAPENPADEQEYFSPYPIELGFERVTDETATVTMLDPQAAVWHFPNEITARDWNGWVQERGLYFPQRWEAQFQPLVRMADPAESPLDSGMLLGSYGTGSYLYTSLVWYRQLRAGVPGAFRLFMNLLAVWHLSQP